MQNLIWSDRERFTLAFQDQDIRVYRNETALSRPYLVPLAVRAPAALQLKEMAKRGFDPEHMLLVDASAPGAVGTGGASPGTTPLEGPSDALGAGSWVAGRGSDGVEPPLADAPPAVTADESGRASASPAGTVALTRYDGDRLRAEVDVASPDGAWLFVADTYDPAWRATVDGRPAPVRLANAMVRTVAVPAGHHLVEMRYAPAPLQLGGTVSLLAGMVVLGVLLVGVVGAAYEGRARALAK